MADHFDEDQHGHAGDQDNADQGNWQDEQPVSEPPLDDFADPVAEETATVVSEETEMPQEEEATSAPRKTSPLLPVFAGLVGIAALGGLLYWQFGSNSNIPSYQAEPLKMPSESAAMNSAITPTNPAPAPAVSPAATDIANLKPAEAPASDVAPTSALAPVTDASNVPPPTPPTSATQPSSVTPAASANVAASTTNAASSPPAGPAPSVLDKMITGGNVPPPATASAPTATTTTTTVAGVPAPAPSPATETRIDTLSTQVDQLQKALEQANQQLAEVNAQLASSNEQRAKLEQKQTAMPVERTTSKHHVTHHVAHKTVKHTVVAHKAPSSAVAHDTYVPASSSGYLALPASYGTVPPAPAPVAMQTHWVLRAATPDEAWVATDATTPDLRHVQKGDELPGIGRIRAIRQVGNGWVIEGSQASLH